MSPLVRLVVLAFLVPACATAGSAPATTPPATAIGVTTPEGDAVDQPGAEILLALDGPEELRTRYADQRPRGQYRIYLDKDGRPSQATVVSSVSGADELVVARLRTMRWKPQAKPFQLLVPVVVALPYPAREPSTPPTAASTQRPRNMPIQEFHVQVLSGDSPRLPDAIKAAAAGHELKGLYKICVGRHGRITGVSILASIPDGGDDAVMASLFGWKLKPQPVPICSIMQFIFDIQP